MIRTTLLLLLGLAAAAVAETEPRWPLDLETRYLTSNFMEHRPGRFHAGIDLKTEGVTGFPVFAAEDGWISRIRLTPYGYGRVIYLTGDSGRTYVYAHLERLADRWRALVRPEQRRRGGWNVSLFHPPDRHRVDRGEVLALTGRSGTTGPHLHFEVRESGDAPVDPQAHGFAVDDRIPPRILAVRAIPAAPGARVGGGAVARRAPTPDDGVSDLPPLHVDGPVAFTARLLEQTDAARHRLAPWRLAVTLDDSLVFESRNERFTFAAQRAMRLEWLETPSGRERWLHRRPGDALPGRSGEGWSLDPAVLTPGPHRAVVRAEDRAGNAVAYGFELIAGSDAASPGWEPAPLAVTAGDGSALTPYLFRGPEGEERALDAAPVIVLADSLDAAETARAWLEQGLAWAGWSARVESPDWRLKEKWPLDFIAEVPEDAALYVLNGRGEWRLAAAVRVENGGGQADLDGPGRYALFVDERSPYLGPGPEEGLVGPGPPSRHPAVSAPVWEVVPIRVEDRGAGIDAGSIRVELDGRFLPCEPDPLRHRVLVELPDDTAPGAHALWIRAEDRAGRAVERRYALELAR